MQKVLFIWIIALFQFGCEVPRPPSYSVLAINGHSGKPLYEVSVPHSWIRKELARESSLDTTKPIAEFFIPDRQIRITVHQFPFAEEKERIPPQAQIQRWQQQLKPVDPASLQTVSVSAGGFVGMRFEGVGSFHNQPAAMIAWSMQLAKEYITDLNSKEMFADYTIKVTGPSSLVSQHRHEIETFAQSFRLIEELTQ